MTKTDIMLLQRVAQGPVSFTHGVNARGATKLLRSTISSSQQKHLHRLALGGWVAEVVNPKASISPPETTVTYSLTSLGREELGIHKRLEPNVHHVKLPSESQLERQSMEPI